MASDVAEAIVLKARELHAADLQAEPSRAASALDEHCMRLAAGLCLYRHELDVDPDEAYNTHVPCYTDVKFSHDMHSKQVRLAFKAQRSVVVGLKAALKAIPDTLVEQLEDSLAPGYDYMVTSASVDLVQGQKDPGTSKWHFNLARQCVYELKLRGPYNFRLPPNEVKKEEAAALMSRLTDMVEDALEFAINIIQ